LAGASPYGALDMASNVWERAEPDNAGDGRYIVRGGAFHNDSARVACGARDEGRSGHHVNVVGLRVVFPGP
jgi:formylglycine-generating enzyme required for sulfatase activity